MTNQGTIYARMAAAANQQKPKRDANNISPDKVKTTKTDNMKPMEGVQSEDKDNDELPTPKELRKEEVNWFKKGNEAMFFF